MSSETPDLVIKRVYDNSIELVYQAWTDPEYLGQWFAPGEAFSTAHVEMDLKVGGRFRIGIQPPPGGPTGDQPFYVAGVFQEIVPLEKLVFTWAWEWHGPRGEESLVTVEFERVAEGTQLTLIHKRLPDQQQVQEHTQGWNGMLDRLFKTLSEIANHQE